MLKAGIYGLLRVLWLLGPPPAWFGWTLFLLGLLSGVLGVLWALAQHDLKRLLAYHSVENIGIILLGMGTGALGLTYGRPTLSVLGFAGALLHTLNHALFKSLLFFGGGAVERATGERNMEHLGGLIHRMPTTAVTFLLGCAAISALPPLNGFVSEWLTFQAILLGPAIPQWGLKFMIPAVGASLALSAALAAACFVKAFGITFLGRPRSFAAGSAAEVDAFDRGTMIALATLCILAGILPGLVVDALAPVVAELSGRNRLPVQASMPWLSLIPISPERSSYNGILLLTFIAVSGFLAAFAIHRFASRAVRIAPAWDCGFPDVSPATQYTADSFAQPIRRVFGTLVFRATETVEMPPPGSLEPARIKVQLRDLVWDIGYLPLAACVNVAADWLNRVQFLTIRRCLSLVFTILVVLLLGIAVWP
jgi:NADH:ubiquinone oxidoreductase subunit 5 (subunit L)/multisubunit Na+/H+ antiporter MnhA subunit